MSVIDQAENQLCGEDGVEEYEDSALAAADYLGPRHGAEHPYRDGSDHKGREIEE